MTTDTHSAPLHLDDTLNLTNKIYLEGGGELYSQPRMLQGVFSFTGQGLDAPFPLDEALTYVVPAGRRAQLIYFRSGNSCDELICLILMRGGAPMRYFPVGARGAGHTALSVVEDILPNTCLQIYLAAPEGARGTVVVDVGLVEI